MCRRARLRRATQQLPREVQSRVRTICCHEPNPLTWPSGGRRRGVWCPQGAHRLCRSPTLSRGLRMPFRYHFCSFGSLLERWALVSEGEAVAAVPVSLSPSRLSVPPSSRALSCLRFPQSDRAGSLIQTTPPPPYRKIRNLQPQQQPLPRCQPMKIFTNQSHMCSRTTGSAAKATF